MGGWTGVQGQAGREVLWQQQDWLAVSLVDVLAVPVPEEPPCRLPVPAGLRRAGPRGLLLPQVSSSAGKLLLTALTAAQSRVAGEQRG